MIFNIFNICTHLRKSITIPCSNIIQPAFYREPFSRTQGDLEATLRKFVTCKSFVVPDIGNKHLSCISNKEERELQSAWSLKQWLRVFIYNAKTSLRNHNLTSLHNQQSSPCTRWNGRGCKRRIWQSIMPSLRQCMPWTHGGSYILQMFCNTLCLFHKLWYPHLQFKYLLLPLSVQADFCQKLILMSQNL